MTRQQAERLFAEKAPECDIDIVISVGEATRVAIGAVHFDSWVGMSSKNADVVAFTGESMGHPVKVFRRRR